MSIQDLDQEEWINGVSNNDNSVILDVRTETEWASGHIANSTLCDIMLQRKFIEQLENLDKSLPYYVYCRSGGRSGQACLIMQEMGFKEVFNLRGGMMSWRGEINTPKSL